VTPSLLADIAAPTSGSVSTGPCQPCPDAQRQAEYDQMMRLYRDAIANCQGLGWQHGDDSGYYDPGGGAHTTPGICADWVEQSWGALATRTWQCWSVYKIRARKRVPLARIYHHFLYLVPRCGGRKTFLDPWSHRAGPHVYSEDEFFAANGFFSWWTHQPLGRHRAGDPPKQI
jgi:hypothetical protein